MTDSTLAGLLARRNAALKRTENRGGWGTRLCDLSPPERAEVDAASREFREADGAIVAELVRRDRPARLGAVELHLTYDRLHFAEVDATTRRPVWLSPSARFERCLLYRYTSGSAPAVAGSGVRVPPPARHR